MSDIADRGRPRTRWLVTGAGGMPGRDVLSVLAGRPDVQVTAAGKDELDNTDPGAVQEAVPGHQIVLNAAAWTDVEAAVGEEVSATRVNGTDVRYLADACAAGGARLLHISTDYVFEGRRSTPYPESAPTAPLNAYGPAASWPVSTTSPKSCLRAATSCGPPGCTTGTAAASWAPS